LLEKIEKRVLNLLGNKMSGRDAGREEEGGARGNVSSLKRRDSGES